MPIHKFGGHMLVSSKTPYFIPSVKSKSLAHTILNKDFFRIVANYLVWNVIVENIAFLSDEIIEKYKNILSTENQTLPTREELCINLSRKL